MATDLKLDQLCQDHLDGLADAIVDYCLAEYGPELGAQRALSAVGITTRACGVRVPHGAHETGETTSCPGYRLTSWTARNRATAAGITASSPGYLTPGTARRCANCPQEISIAHPDGTGWVWKHEPGGYTLCIVNGERPGTHAEPDALDPEAERLYADERADG